MQKSVTLNEVLDLAKQLSTVDKVRLIEQITPQIKRELKVARPTPRRSLRGLWKGLDLTEEDLAQARREMGKPSEPSGFIDSLPPPVL